MLGLSFTVITGLSFPRLPLGDGPSAALTVPSLAPASASSGGGPAWQKLWLIPLRCLQLAHNLGMDGRRLLCPLVHGLADGKSGGWRERLCLDADLGVRSEGHEALTVLCGRGLDEVELDLLEDRLEDVF
jgi:hypothetical protein